MDRPDRPSTWAPATIPPRVWNVRHMIARDVILRDGGEAFQGIPFGSKPSAGKVRGGRNFHSAAEIIPHPARSAARWAPFVASMMPESGPPTFVETIRSSEEAVLAKSTIRKYMRMAKASSKQLPYHHQRFTTSITMAGAVAVDNVIGVAVEIHDLSLRNSR